MIAYRASDAAPVRKEIDVTSGTQASCGRTAMECR